MRDVEIKRRGGTAGWVLPAVVVFLFIVCLVAVAPW